MPSSESEPQSSGFYFTSLERIIFRSVVLVIGLISLLASLFSWMSFFVFYWPYRNQFNEMGRYFNSDDGIVYHDQSAVMILPAVFFLGITLLLFWLRSLVSPRAKNEIVKPILDAESE